MKNSKVLHFLQDQQNISTTLLLLYWQHLIAKSWNQLILSLQLGKQQAKWAYYITCKVIQLLKSGLAEGFKPPDTFVVVAYVHAYLHISRFRTCGIFCVFCVYSPPADSLCNLPLPNSLNLANLPTDKPKSSLLLLLTVNWYWYRHVSCLSHSTIYIAGLPMPK